MADNRIGIEIATRTSGDESLKQHAAMVQELNSGWSQFNDLRREAAEQFPNDLKRQNVFIQQQLNMLKELETVGSRERMAKLQDQKASARGYFERQAAEKSIRREKAAHIESRVTSTEARAYRMQWALDQGIGDPSDPDLLTQTITGAGIRGGGMGMVSAGVSTATSALTRKMGAMSLGGKLALGVGGGLALTAIYKGAQALKEGWDKYTSLAPELLKIAAISGKLPEDAEIFRDRFLEVAKATATTHTELTQYEQTWMRILGTGAGPGSQAGPGGTLESVLNISQAYGIDKGLGVEFTARMGMTGYRAGTSDTILKQTIADGMASGISIARLPEYLQGIMSVTAAVMQSAVVVDPGLMSGYAREIGALGVPFQGERGATLMSKLHRGIQGGMGFQAARRILGTGASLFDITALQQQGLNDPRMLAEYTAMYGEMAGVGGKTGGELIEARKRQAFLMGKGTGIPLLQLLNPDVGINSLLEMDLSKITPGEARELAGITGEDQKIRDAIKAYKDTFGFETMQAAIAADIAKINTAAAAFESAAGVFYKAVNVFADFTLEEDIMEVPTSYDATDLRNRDFGIVSKEVAPSPGMVRSQYRRQR